MSRWNSYLASSIKIITEYRGLIPLSAWLKDHFRANRQMGSKDRKIIAEAVYSFYRIGHAFREINDEERILTALFLCGDAPNELLHFFKPAWNNAIQFSMFEKMQLLGTEDPISVIKRIFPLHEALSAGIDADRFNESFLEQPDLFLRLRPGKEEQVFRKLDEAAIAYRKMSECCIRLPNGTKAETILELDVEAVVQDYNSQMTGNLIRPASAQSQVNLWDCCAASGGKSIMAHDLISGLHLTVSDVRESILHNLHTRLKTAGIEDYHSFKADLTRAISKIKTGPFDMILADLPCSGSGTWARTPEQLYFFDPARIKHYSDLQRGILVNLVPQLKNGGRLVYITCSVFREENESVAQFIQEKLSLKLVDMQLLKGYQLKADSMFVAVFKKDRVVT